MAHHRAKACGRRVLRIGVSIGVMGSLAALLAGCYSTTGDFGRASPGWFENNALGITGTVSAKLRGEPASFYALTEDEKELRARAWNFLMPEADAPVLSQRHDQLAFHQVLPHREPDITLFHRTVMGGPQLGSWVGYSPTMRALTGAQSFQSLTSRYNRVRDVISSDHALVPHFKLISAQVRQADQVRARGLDHIQNLTDEQRSEAVARICENAALIARVHWAFHDRAAQYRYSLEHLLIEGPEREAIPSERTLMAFEADLGRFRKDSQMDARCAAEAELPPVIAPRPLVRKG